MFDELLFIPGATLQIIVHILQVILQTIVHIIGFCIFYGFIILYMLIPFIILLGILAYKSKPTEDHFKENFDKIINIVLRYDKSGKSKKSGYFLEKINNGIKYIQRKNVKNQFEFLFYDLGIVRLAWVFLEEKSNDHNIFVGVFGTWIPIS